MRLVVRYTVIAVLGMCAYPAAAIAKKPVRPCALPPHSTILAQDSQAIVVGISPYSELRYCVYWGRRWHHLLGGGVNNDEYLAPRQLRLIGTRIAFLWETIAPYEEWATTGDLSDPKTITSLDVGAAGFDDSIFLAPDHAIIWQITIEDANGDRTTYIETWSPRQPVVTVLDQGYGVIDLSLTNSLATWFHDDTTRTATI
jgi:hypothetical protein